MARAFKLALALLTAYLLIGAALAGWVSLRYHLMPLADIEPARCRPEAPERGWLPFLKFGPRPGAYGPGNPFPKGMNTPGARTTINNLGARNRVDLPAAGRELVVLLGDSFFFGHGLDDAGTISAHLNRLDPERAYLNLAFSGANLHDAVSRYGFSRARAGAPRGVMLQLLWDNDLYASIDVHEAARQRIEQTRPLVLFPYSLVLTGDRLLNLYISKTEQRVLDDLSPGRYEHYIKEPLERLLRLTQKDGARLLVVSYDNPHPEWRARFAGYAKRLQTDCTKNKVTLLRLTELVTNDQFNDRLPDGHPTGALNRALAASLIKSLF